MAQNKSDLQQHLETQLHDIQQRIKAFEERTNEARDTAQQDIEAQLDDLRRRNKEMEAQLKEVRNAGTDVFQKAADDFQNTLTDFAAAVDNVFFDGKIQQKSGDKPDRTVADTSSVQDLKVNNLDKQDSNGNRS